MRLALDNNRDLLKAAARVEQMRQLYGIDKANFYPEIGGMAGASYETNNYNGAGTTKDPEYDLKLPVSWEINLWGSLAGQTRRSRPLQSVGGRLPRNEHDHHCRCRYGLLQAHSP